MQVCPECERVYDESEDCECPYCHAGGEDYSHVIVYDREKGEAIVVPREEAHLYE